MVNQNSETSELTTTLTTTAKGIAWCIAWGGSLIPQHPEVIQQMRQALQSNSPFPDSVQPFLAQAQQLNQIPFPNTQVELAALVKHHPEFWENRIGLVYGGATKIKQYVFEAAKLPDIRGASALLDRINLFDLRAFFGKEKSISVEQWLDRPDNFPGLRQALIPELIIYSTGGNILAFCPVAYVDQLANAIEKRYTHETLTANSCAVGATFRLLEIRLGLLKESIAATPWLDWLQRPETKANPVVQAYFNNCTDEDFRNRKNFNELVTKLAGLFNQRRSGNDTIGRPSRRYPPMFETHPYLRRDEGDRRSAVIHAKSDTNDPTKGLPGDPYFSEASARKRLVGQITKRDSSRRWYEETGLSWQSGDGLEGWVNKFEKFLFEAPQNYYGKVRSARLSRSGVEEARSVREIGDASSLKGFIAYIYADGNNMGGYIQNQIKTPEDYRRFSRDIFDATEKSVYAALDRHLQPHEYYPDAKSGRQSQKPVWIHPFEIVTIGGDDVLLIVPADQALAIAQTIGEEFEKRLVRKGYTTNQSYEPEDIHRYEGSSRPTGNDQCVLSTSIGVLITAENTPIYYAENLVSQLLKSAKKRAKDLKAKGYLGGTIDFLTLKSVTMLSSNIETFRQEGLTQTIGNHTLKQYAAPYTLHEIGGLIKTVEELKKADFPRSQLYQIRSLLDRGKRITMLNYRYFRVRMKNENQQILKREFEDPWCTAKTNGGNLAPWMSLPTNGRTDYETIWRDLVDLYAFIDKDDTPKEDDLVANPINLEV